HHPRPHHARLGAGGRTRGRPAAHPRLFPLRPPVSRADELKKLIRDVPGFPQPGIIFRDITPILADRDTFTEIVDLMSRRWIDKGVDYVAAIEARGFIPGAAIALRLHAGFIPIRKAGKLPWKVVSHSYQLEYGTDQLDI